MKINISPVGGSCYFNCAACGEDLDADDEEKILSHPTSIFEESEKWFTPDKEIPSTCVNAGKKCINPLSEIEAREIP